MSITDKLSKDIPEDILNDFGGYFDKKTGHLILSCAINGYKYSWEEIRPDEIDKEEELKGLSYEDQCMKILDNIFINGTYKLIKIT